MAKHSAQPVRRRHVGTIVLAIVAALVVTGSVSAAAVASARPGHGHSSPAPTYQACTPASSTPTPTPSTVLTPTPTATSTPASDDAPLGPVGPFQQTYVENFNTTAAANGSFASTYAGTWQPYADGTGGVYYSGSQISAHDGYMDVTLGAKGAAGTFGTPDGAWSHQGGMFSIRLRATGGTGNGVAVMLWPNDNVWAEGEIDYPEGQFNDQPHAYQHSTVAGQESTNVFADATGVDWADWHTYSEQWIPGKSMTYLLDGKVIGTVTKDVPTTAHRYMFQVGTGVSGHLDVDWVTTYEYQP